MLNTLTLTGRKYSLAVLYDSIDFLPNQLVLHDFPNISGIRSFFGTVLVRSKKEEKFDFSRSFKSNRFPLLPNTSLKLEDLIFMPAIGPLFEAGCLKDVTDSVLTFKYPISYRSYKMKIIDLICEKLHSLNESDEQNKMKFFPRANILDITKSPGYALIQRIIQEDGIKHTYVCISTS